MKNPLKYLKHIVKDPVTTLAEADARENEILPLFYGSVGLLLVSVILQIAAKLDFMATFSFIGFAGAAFCFFLFSVLEGARERFEGLTCNKCNIMAKIETDEDFYKYITFTIEKDAATFKSGQHPKVTPTNGVHSHVSVSASASAVVSVALTCPHCGEVKYLRYCATPLECHTERKNIRVIDYELVHQAMETAVLTVVNDYNNPDRKPLIPYSIQSSKNPHFNERTTFKGANATDAHPEYMGVRIDYRKDVDEMLLHYFLLNELNGSLGDPAKSGKKKFPLLKILKRVIKVPNFGKRAKSDAASEESQEAPATAECNSSQDTAVAVAETAEAPEAAIAGCEPTPEAAPIVLQEVAEPQPAQADCCIVTPEPTEAEIPEADTNQNDVAAPVSEAMPEPAPAAVPEKKAATKKRPAEKGGKKAIIAVIAVCAALITAGTIFGILAAGNRNNAGTEPTVSAPDRLNVGDYVGYWRISGNQEKEFILHNGDHESIRFSLRYSDEYELNDIVAQLYDNVATFSMAIDGGVIKGSVTLLKDAITVEITHSTLAMVPVEVMEYTEQRMTSWEQGEEQETPENSNPTPTEGTLPPATEKPTAAPTAAPTEAPTKAPTEAPTEAPTKAPTEAPTEEPTEAPTEPEYLIVVPNVVGETVHFWSYASWEVWPEGEDLVPKVVVEYHDTAEPETVFMQVPAAGELVEAGTEVTLYVSGGRDPHRYPEEYYIYEISNGEATITGLHKFLYGEVTLPNHLGGAPVTTLAEEAFGQLLEEEYGRTSCYFTSLTIPDGVKTIEWRAFDFCPYIETLHISKTVTNISPWAFRGFMDEGKVNIFVDADNPKYHAAGNCIIETDSKKIIHGFASSIIPSDGSVTTIGYMSFSAVHGMEKIVIPDCITEIEAAAFDQCGDLTDITIGKGITTLGDDVFARCGFVDLVIPDHITALEATAFQYNLELKSITIPDSVVSIDGRAFEGCDNLKTVYFESKAQKAKFKDLFPGCKLVVLD